MDVSDFNDPSGISMALAGSEDAGMARLARQSALHQATLDGNDRYAAIVLAVKLLEALHIIGETEEAGFLLARALPDSHDLLPFLSGLVRRLRDCPVPKELSRMAAETRIILTPRERHILQLIGRGMSNKRIAQDLNISPETVKSHAKHIFVKLKVQTRAQAVAHAVGLRLL
ncbi:MAG: LuxR C-terminal-related transcriptional regulator [Steroidobacteraceae bacterium]